jgi:peptidoglycan/LPS O-acetylase OafA/YrhL
VVLYHAGFEAFSGGYLGVDVFFVISGYLITGIIASDLQSGSFSLRRFYERRARRILPALFVVVALCMVAAWLWMIPDQLVEFGASLIAVPLFVSNLLFWRQSGYFATEASLNPLLHTWSLAVEEQFYILFPLALLALTALGRRLVLPALILVALSSLGLAEWTTSRDADTSFYLAHTRMWELFSGAIIAMSSLERSGRGSLVRQSLAGLGLILCAIAFGSFTEGSRHPGLLTVIPVLGTCLIFVCANSESAVGRVLSYRPLVWTGLISYSLYLYHLPMFAFLRIADGHAEAPPDLLVPIGIS